MHEIDDFAETAALASNLDLVISTDNGMAHLIGALGIPLWLLTQFAPDWRWLTARTDSPWYPTARLFRQDRLADWSDVIARRHTSLYAAALSNRDAPAETCPLKRGTPGGSGWDAVK